MLCASYAKINLFLEVWDKLPDNYHQIETLLCTIDLCDSIRYTLTKKPGIKLWSNLPEMTDEDNLIYKVAVHLQGQTKTPWGVDIYLDKQIPVAAGLGGGSSNAAITILALNQSWDLNLSPQEQADIAARFGSDISFFLDGGTAWGSGRGERITTCEDILIDNVLLVNPNLQITSTEAYQRVEIPEPSERRSFNREQIENSCFNRLEVGIRSVYSVVDQIIHQFEQQGAKIAMMSGSGPTCFGIFGDRQSLNKCQENFNRLGFWTKKVRTISRKEYQSVCQA